MTTSATAKKGIHEIIANDGHVVVKLTGKLDTENAKAFESDLPAIAGEKPRDAILNCEHLSEVSAQGLRALLQLQKNLKTVNKQIRLISVADSIQKLIKQNGMDSSLKCSANLKTALTEMGLHSSQALDVNFINPFIAATLKVLETQASTKAKIGNIYRKDAHEKFLGDISGVIGLISDAFTGSVVISFPGPTFLKIMSRMLGEEYTKITKEIEDGAGELTNIIFGQAKITLNEKGYGIKTALPSVVAGADHSILQVSSSGSRVVIPFEADIGPFFIEICASA